MAGTAAAMFRFGYYSLTRIRGGLAMGTIVANALLGTISGSSTATSAMMSSIAVPEMRRYGYDVRIASGVVAAAGTLAILIPPSLALLIYGIVTESSIGHLFLAGVIPGILTGIGLCGVVAVLARRRPAWIPEATRSMWPEARRAGMAASPALVLGLGVLFALYSGIMTATEAAALGAFGALLIGLAGRNLGPRAILTCLLRATRASSMIFAIVIGAMIFGYFISSSQIAVKLVDYVVGLGIPSIGVVLVIVGVYLILGFFMDQLAILFLTLPLTFPVVTSLGYDPIWFGIIVTKTAEIGLLTPPLGLNVFVTAAASKVKVQDVFAGTVPFLVFEFLFLAVLIFVPELSTWLPSQLAD